MIPSESVILKPGKDKAVRNRHHWIFSGAIDKLPSFKDGDFLPVYASTGEFLGTGYFNRQSGIRGRMLSFDRTPPLTALDNRLTSALALRRQSFDAERTNAFRLINGDGDGIPGLTVDVYDQTVVLQSATKGIDRLKPLLVERFNSLLYPKTIYEKSLLSSRREEGLKETQGFLSGVEENEVHFLENGLRFCLDLARSQKTGFFLDHREMRSLIGELSENKRVLNAFSYTGGFSVYALAGGARSVDSVDISKEAVEAVEKHMTLNGFSSDKYRNICADVFEFLREKELNYELVILDPPAFAKNRKDIIAACRGYKDINRLAMKKMPPKSFLLTCSCSHYVDEELFQKVIFQAALEAGREVRIIGKHRLGPDHPINVFHPESQYLKSFLLFID